MAKDDKEFIDKLRSLSEENWERFCQELNMLEGKAYVDRMLALYEYIQPKLSRQEGGLQKDAPITINLIAGKQQPKQIELGEVVDYTDETEEHRD